MPTWAAQLLSQCVQQQQLSSAARGSQPRYQRVRSSWAPGKGLIRNQLLSSRPAAAAHRALSCPSPQALSSGHFGVASYCSRSAQGKSSVSADRAQCLSPIHRLGRMLLPAPPINLGFLQGLHCCPWLPKGQLRYGAPPVSMLPSYLPMRASGLRTTPRTKSVRRLSTMCSLTVSSVFNLCCSYQRAQPKHPYCTQ